MEVIEILKQEGRDVAYENIFYENMCALRECLRELTLEVKESKKSLVRGLLAEENLTVANIADLADVSAAFVCNIKKELK